MAMTMYEDLLCEARPEIIETVQRYEEVSGRLAELVRKGSRRTVNETRRMKLLVLLEEDYDRRHAMPQEDSSPGERLYASRPDLSWAARWSEARQARARMVSVGFFSVAVGKAAPSTT